MDIRSKKSAASLVAVGGVDARFGGLPLRRALLALAAVMLAAGLVVLAVPRAQAGVSRPAALHVNPFPGTPDAAANSPIIFSSLTSTSELRSVTVRGSRSGVHSGRLQMLPARAGVAFAPSHPFAPGERVQVVARLSSPAAGAASGAPGTTRLTFSFGVLAPVAAPPTLSDPGDPSASARAATASSYMSFHSTPVHPTKVYVPHDSDTSSGDIFITPDHTQQRGPMIINGQGQLVWFMPVPGKVSNLAVQSYQGKPVLTFWEGPTQNGKNGYDVIMSSSYQVLKTVKAVGTGYSADLHDFQITPQGTAFINAVVPVKADLSSVGGPKNGYVWDNVIQEIDIATGNQIWSWHSYGHIPLNATHKPPNGSFCDCYHLNSIQQLSDGSLLVSSRNTWSIYKISTKTGQILWTLGGKYNQFNRGTGVGWAWQHDAHRTGDTLTMFDDGAAPQVEQQSAAKVIHLDVGKMKATLVHSYYHNPPLISSAQGSAQLLPNGNMFVGWGTEPDFSEYNSSGQQIMTGSFPLGETSYRAFRFQWTGQPSYPPSAHMIHGSSGSTVWASWNGATQVSSWRVLGAGGPTGPWATLPTSSGKTTTPRTSFEATISLPTQPAYVEVQALNSQGQVLPNGTSSAVSASSS